MGLFSGKEARAALKAAKRAARETEAAQEAEAMALAEELLPILREHDAIVEAQRDELKWERVAALKAAMVGAASAVSMLQAQLRRSDGDLSAFAGGLDAEAGEYRGGIDPFAALRTREPAELDGLFRVATWAYLVDVISEFWWPDYRWEIDDFAAVFDVRSRGERRVIAFGPDPGAVRRDQQESIDYRVARNRMMVRGLVESGDIAMTESSLVLMLVPTWHDSAVMGRRAMEDTLREATPGGRYHYVGGVAEYRESAALAHPVPPPVGEASAVGIDRAFGLCEHARATLADAGPFAGHDPALVDDLGDVLHVFAEQGCGATDTLPFSAITDAAVLGYAVREAERAPHPHAWCPGEGPRRGERVQRLLDRSAGFEHGLPDCFIGSEAGWAAAKRRNDQFVATRSRTRGFSTADLDLSGAMRFGYALRAAVEAEGAVG